MKTKMKPHMPGTSVPHKAHLTRHKLVALAICGLFAGSDLAFAEIAQSPLFLAKQPNPNIMFTLDDSGSMNWNCIPDTICPKDTRPGWERIPTSFPFENDGLDESEAMKLNIALWRSVAFNGLAYDPNIRYYPWQNWDGSYYPQSQPENALHDPRVAGGINLINTAKDVPGKPRNQYLAFYYKYKHDNAGKTPALGHFERIEIKAGSTYDKGPDRTDCSGSTCSFEEESKNFANWYTYYRKRSHTAIAGASQAFNPLTGNQRIGYAQINQLGGSIRYQPNEPTATNIVDGVDTSTVILGVRDFVGENRKKFYEKLLASQGNGLLGTPLRRALFDVGQYFSRTDDKGPWAEKPGVSRGTEYSCRKTFHILMTDGYWNHYPVTAIPDLADADNIDGEEYTHPQTKVKYKYIASGASTYFKSGAQNTLADIAMYYWNRDLRSDLANNVPTNPSDEAFWQHIVQYTVGLGVTGTLKYPDDEAALKNGKKTWPNPVNAESATSVDDLWHAAVNGHGLYFSAKNPKAFREGLRSALEDIAKQSAAASTVALNFNSSAAGGARAYVPSFESGSWTGHLTARKVVNGVVTGDVAWSAEDVLPAPADRNLFTWDKGNKKAEPFTWNKLTESQKQALGNENVLNYLRGDDSKERRNGGSMRDRAKSKGDKAAILGDIVNSSPLYVAQTNWAYHLLPANAGGNSYRTYLKEKAGKAPMLYVGANDGMLHAFFAENGKEALGFIPNSVYPHLKSYSEPTYSHHYMVDGQIIEGDVFKSDDDGGSWRTLIVGSTGAGAKSLFALDVTNPAKANSDGTKSSNLKADNILWEKDSTDLDDLGHMLGKAAIVRLQNGSWGVIFGNGYESKNQKAVLYILDAFTGAEIARFDTGSGSASAPNGLSTPALVFNEKRELAAAYAGDLQGNVWRFDLSGADKSKWKISFSGEALFTAKNKDGKAQPITLRPAIGYHPQGGYMVNFATGKYFETNDGSSTDTQTVYGLWDKSDIDKIVPSTITGARTAILQEQTLSADSSASDIGGANLTTTDVNWEIKRGWFIDLTLGRGERGVGEPFITDDTTLWVTTLDPVSDPCASGGDSRLMGFDFLSGGASKNPVFDTNGDGVVDAKDKKISVIKTGGTVASSGVYKKPKATDTPDKPCAENDPNCGCDKPGRPSCPCEGSVRKVLINRLDGTTQEMTINPICRPPLRTWHEINSAY